MKVMPEVTKSENTGNNSQTVIAGFYQRQLTPFRWPDTSHRPSCNGAAYLSFWLAKAQILVHSSAPLAAVL